MKKSLFGLFHHEEDRKWYVNVLISVFALIGVLVLPSIFALIIKDIIKNKYVCSLIGSLIFGLILVFLYRRDLKKELNIYIKGFGKIFKLSLKYYFVGILLTITFSVLLAGVLKGSSQNETLVRELLYSHTLYMFINIVFIAPVIEELVYRKSVSTWIKNKWVFAIVSGILFGSAHIATNVFSGTFILTDLLYILPYGSYGFAFALMDHDSKTTFSSIVINIIHNLLTGLMIMNIHYIGVF